MIYNCSFLLYLIYCCKNSSFIVYFRINCGIFIWFDFWWKTK